MARPGFVHEVDERTPPLVVCAGDRFHAERLPLGARVIYPPEPLAAVPDLRDAIDTALAAPLDTAPLAAQLRPGMRLTLAFDDLTTPVPRMQEPDVRARIAEGVLALAARAGVDDVALVCARGLHRRLTDAELRRVLGERVFRSFFADGRLIQHDAEDADGLAEVGRTSEGAPVEINRRAAESDLLVLVRVVTSPHGVAAEALTAGLGSTATITRAGPGDTAPESPPVFAVEAVLDLRPPGGPLEVTGKREWEWSLRERAVWAGLQAGLPLTPARSRRRLLDAATTPHRVIAVNAGAPGAVAGASRERALAQQRVEVDGPVDVGVVGVPQANPHNVAAVGNPVLAAWDGLSAKFGAHTGAPLVRPGGALVLYHPLRPQFSALHHPSYVDFYADVLAREPDPAHLADDEAKFGSDPWYRHLYSTSYAFHGVHPFRLWAEVAAARSHCGDVVWVGADREVAGRLGFRAASTLADALEIVASSVGRTPRVGYVHPQGAVVDVR